MTTNNQKTGPRSHENQRDPEGNILSVKKEGYMQNIDELKLGQVITDLLDEVRIHAKQFSEPCPSKLLSAKFAKRVLKLGGYRQLLKDLEGAGKISVLRLRSGGVLVSLGQNLTPKDFDLDLQTFKKPHTQEPKKQIAAWVTHPQSRTLWKSIDDVPAEFRHHDKPALHWGFGRYWVNPDGTLSLDEQNYDTSD